MNINLNQICRVTLTDYGARHFNNIHAYMGKNAPEDKSEGDVIETELWQLMHDFGEVLYNGNPRLPFKGNDIEII